MLLRLPKNLPAIELLKHENIFVENSFYPSSQGMRPLKVVILNLMPIKITTETDFIRLLSNSPLPIEIDFLRIKNHTPKNTPIEHLMAFYKDFDVISEQHYDGMIVTGAPVEQMEFEDVNYWDEITGIFDWARTHVTSTLYICWAAQAALYHFYKVPKYPLDEKMFGVFRHCLLDNTQPLFRGFDDEFFVPHSRYTEIRKEDILKVSELKLLSESDESGVYIVTSRAGCEFYITGHSEYASNTLDSEYKRDLAKSLPIAVPKNYYRNDNPEEPVVNRWRAHANLLFSNWLNYFVRRSCTEHFTKI